MVFSDSSGYRTIPADVDNAMFPWKVDPEIVKLRTLSIAATVLYSPTLSTKVDLTIAILSGVSGEIDRHTDFEVKVCRFPVKFITARVTDLPLTANVSRPGPVLLTKLRREMRFYVELTQPRPS